MIGMCSENKDSHNDDSIKSNQIKPNQIKFIYHNYLQKYINN